jgi:hypothetical protein
MSQDKVRTLFRVCDSSQYRLSQSFHNVDGAAESHLRRAARTLRWQTFGNTESPAAGDP